MSGGSGRGIPSPRAGGGGEGLGPPLQREGRRWGHRQPACVSRAQKALLLQTLHPDPPPGKGQLLPLRHTVARRCSSPARPLPAREASAVTLPFPTSRCQTSGADLWRREDAIKALASEEDDDDDDDDDAAPPLHFDREHAAGAAAACQWEPVPAAVGDAAGLVLGRWISAPVPEDAHSRA